MAPKTGKHIRKKRKLAEEAQPLGSTLHLDDEAEKDDEERRLESILFGKVFLSEEDIDKDNILIISDDEGVGNGLEQLDDSDVRTANYCSMHASSSLSHHTAIRH